MRLRLVYELRTYALYPGTMAEFLRLAETEGFPLLCRYLKTVNHGQLSALWL